MGLHIIFSPLALDDLAIIVRRIARDNPVAAEKIGNALIDRVSQEDQVIGIFRYWHGARSQPEL